MQRLVLLIANLKIHLHCLVLDGVYRTSEGVPVLQEARAPTMEELHGLVLKMITRIMRLLTHQGHLIEEQGMTYRATSFRSVFQGCSVMSGSVADGQTDHGR